MSIQKFENFEANGPKEKLILETSKMIQNGKSTEDIVDFITYEIIADVKNKLGYITSMIDAISLLNDDDPNIKEYANSRLNKSLEMSKKAIEYIRSYNYDNKYNDI